MCVCVQNIKIWCVFLFLKTLPPYNFDINCRQFLFTSLNIHRTYNVWRKVKTTTTMARVAAQHKWIGWRRCSRRQKVIQHNFYMLSITWALEINDRINSFTLRTYFLFFFSSCFFTFSYSFLRNFLKVNKKIFRCNMKFCNFLN